MTSTLPQPADKVTIALQALRYRRVVAALPPEQTLAQLRARCHLTQEQLAARLGKRQARISRIESHPNPHVALLRSYVEALGGELHLLVRFPRGDFRVETRPASGARPVLG